MLTLKNIIIDRLKDIKTFKNEIGQFSMSNSTPIYDHRQTEISSFKLLAIRHRYQQIENKRLRNELSLLKQLSQSDISIKQIAILCLQIMQFVDTDYFLTIGQQQEQQIYQHLINIFISFLQKYHCSKIQYVIKYLISPPPQIKINNFIIWLSEWSKAMLYQIINQKKEHHNTYLPSFGSGILEQSRNVTKYHTKKFKTDQGDFRSELNQVQFHSVESFYSFIKPELTNYYTFHDCIDLDMDFVLKMRRSTRLLQTLNLSQITNFLIKKCNYQTSMAIGSYRSDFQERNKQTANSMYTELNINKRRETTINVNEERGSTSFFALKRTKSIKYQQPNYQCRKSPKVSAFSGLEDLFTSKSKNKMNIKNVSSGKQSAQSDKLNFIKRNQRRHSRQTYKQLNYTTLLYKHQNFNESLNKIDREPRGMSELQQIIKKSVQRQTDKVFVMEGNNIDVFEDNRIKWEHTKLKNKKCLLKANREQTLKQTLLNALIISNN